MGHVEHLAVQRHGARTFGKRLDHAPGMGNFLDTRREGLVYDWHLVWMNRDLPGEPGPRCCSRLGPQSL